MLIFWQHLTNLHHVTLLEEEYVALSYCLLPSGRILQWCASTFA